MSKGLQISLVKQQTDMGYENTFADKLAYLHFPKLGNFKKNDA